MSFIDSYKNTDSSGVNLCIGIDPSQSSLEAWGLDYSPSGALEYGRKILNAADGLVSVVKPQIAYFEQFGPDGYRTLATLISEARDMGLLVIADAKRGDIGSTIDAYARAWHGVLDDIAEWITKNDTKTIGVVVGATVVPDLKHSLSRLPTSLVLAPGIGNQGASVHSLLAIESGLDRVVASVSRSVAAQGPSVEGLIKAINSL